jgi:hypothetical protein
MKASLFTRTALAACAFTWMAAGQAAAADDAAMPETVIAELAYPEPPIDSGIDSDLPVDGLPVLDIAGPFDELPPIGSVEDLEVTVEVLPEVHIDPPIDALPEMGGPDPIPVPYELGVVEVLPEVHIDPPIDALPEMGGPDPIPVPYELGVVEGVPEPEVTDIVAVICDFPDLPLPEDPTRLVYYSLGGEGFDPTVLRNFGLEEDPAAAALERVMTKAVDQAADKAVQSLTPAPL